MAHRAWVHRLTCVSSIIEKQLESIFNALNECTVGCDQERDEFMTVALETSMVAPAPILLCATRETNRSNLAVCPVQRMPELVRKARKHLTKSAKRQCARQTESALVRCLSFSLINAHGSCGDLARSQLKDPRQISQDCFTTLIHPTDPSHSSLQSNRPQTEFLAIHEAWFLSAGS
jgi:hypothetical protein